MIIGDPVIFGVEPFYGRSQGGETVTILGLNFGVDVTKELVKNFDEVYFTFNGQDLLAQVERWSANQIEVITPRFSLTPLDRRSECRGQADPPSTATSTSEERHLHRSNRISPSPKSPGSRRPPVRIDGGTIVTITGHGFEIPIQVLFGALEATDVQVFDDQSLADNDIITCRTPDYSQQGQTPPYCGRRSR